MKGTTKDSICSEIRLQFQLVIKFLNLYRVEEYAKKCHDLEQILYETQSENAQQKRDSELKL